jgi:hypothetical protein
MLGRYSTMRERIPATKPAVNWYGLGSPRAIESEDGEKLMGTLVKTLAIGLMVGIALKVAMKMVAARI